MTPTSRSTDLLRRSGFAVATVERWLPHVDLRSDCFGFGDLLACNPTRGQIALIQVTTRSNLAARINKAKAIPALLSWLRAGGLAWFHGWHQRAGKWECHQVQVQAEDLAEVVLTPAKRRGRRPVQPTLFGGMAP